MHTRHREGLSQLWQRTSGALLLTCCALLATGCSSYQLQGKVIEGPSSGIYIVSADDPRLNEPGVPQARIALTLDPERLSAKSIGSGASDSDGWFNVPVDEFGAGFLEHDVEVLARQQGFTPAYQTIRLPRSSRRLLIVLAEGTDRVSPRRGDVIDETLRLGEPYMGR
ncbi:hypothetical protein ACERK3_02855 [Phycisphaerales bacterium AB-hyl4]|uniref:Carboxypeptidase regulatory-like domain-containing protein n=1 Tax=Natronomicrosphaera hydrolytica TaxID=3242702 RepID=A0ABV4U2V6_9BACT